MNVRAIHRLVWAVRSLWLLAAAFMVVAALPAGAQAAVGRIGGSGDVTPMGSATYTIPIDVAAGVNGLKPDIGLVYDSQSGDGLAGVGWTLSGFSKIHRCPRTKPLDGSAAGGVTYSATDRFCLDGAPLVQIASGTYGANNMEYRAEVHWYQKVVSVGTQGTGPSYFQVSLPNGLTYLYGSDTDSRITAPNTTEVRVWALNTIQDKFGNQISFTYTSPVTGEYVPDNVTWTSNGGTAPYKIQFTYDDLNTVLPGAVRGGYVWGSQWQATRRLHYIDYSFSGSTVHRYTLNYTSGSTGKSRLLSIQQCNRMGNDCLPLTAIDWQDGAVGLAVAQDGPGLPADRAAYGDYDGNGTIDLFIPVAGSWHVYKSDPESGVFSVDIDLARPVYGQLIGHTLEFDGDGLADLMAVGADGNWHVYLGSGAGCSSGDCNTNISASATWSFALIDVNGDGLSDMVYADKLRINAGLEFGGEQETGLIGEEGSYVSSRGRRGGIDFDGDGRTDLIRTLSTYIPPPVSRTITRFEVSRSFWNLEAIPSARDDLQVMFIVEAGPGGGFLPLDINGDGLTDFMYMSGTCGAGCFTWRYTLSIGKGHTEWASISAPAASMAAIDYDGDGREDLLYACGSQWCIRRSNGDGFESISIGVGGDSPAVVTTLMIADTTGDGYADVIMHNGSKWRHRIRNGNRADLLASVTDGLGGTFKPTYHALTNWAYNAGTGEGYTANATVNPPTTRLVRGGATYVVSQTEETTGVGTGTFLTHYAYWNAKVDGTGRGYLGFESVKETDSRNSVVTETLYKQGFPFIGRPEKVTVWNGANKVSVYDPTWTEQTPVPAGVADSNHGAGSAHQYHFVHLDQEVTESYEVDSGGAHNGQLARTVTHKTNVSGYPWNYTHGAPGHEEVATTSPQSVTTLSSTTDRTFYNGVSAWCLGLPATVSVTKSDGVTTPPARQVAFSYYSNCRPWTETVGTTTAKQLQTTYAYDSLGRLQTMMQDVAGAATPSRQVTVQYTDTANIRPTSETIQVGGVAHAVGHAWNNALGLESGRTNVQGQSTGWAYDDFGRLITETRPAGSSTITYTACSGCWPSNAVYKIRETRTDGFWSESYRDAYGRVVGKANLLASGSGQARQILIYDDMGRLVYETVPYRVVDGMYYGLTRTYDLVGRIKSESRQVSEADTSLQTTSWMYDRLTTTVTDTEGRTRVFVVNPQGNLVTVQEPFPGGTTSYGYTPWGELKSVTDAADHTTTMTYDDERGFLTEVSDPDAGSWTYEYTVWGELYRARDARTAWPNWTLTNTYDALGRLTNRVDYDPVTTQSATTTWSYYDNTNAGTGARLGLLQTATTYAGAVGSTIEFQETSKYNSLALVSQTVTSINGAPQGSYTTDYTYDGEGRPGTITYPTTVSGLRPQFVYTYSNGYLDTVTQVENSVSYPRYDLVAMDARGWEMQASLGNGALDVQTLYDRVNGLVNAIKTGPGLTTGVQNLSFTWDKVGNLKSRTDSNQSGLTETLTYDALNRLTDGARNGITNLDTSYTIDGNINSKRRPDGYTDYYTYTTPGKPHAVSSTAYSYPSGCGSASNIYYYTYDANGNMLTRAFNGTTAYDRWVTWTAFSKPKQISVGSANCGGDCTTFTYGPDRQIVKQVAKAGGATRTIYYVGPHFEVEVGPSVTEYRSHALANGQVVYTQVEDSGGVGWEAYYPLRDHLGSVASQYRTIGAGAQTLSYSYDPFGRRRNANWTDDGSGSQMTATLWNHRGFTGHEMLDNVQLIHMQGRVYDPTLGRFLSPDPLLDDLQMPQSLNPYSYVANNPLSYTDPTGYGLFNFFKRLVSFKWVKNVGPEIIAFVAFAVCEVGSDATASPACTSILKSVGLTAVATTAGHSWGSAGSRNTVSSGHGSWGESGTFGSGAWGNGSLAMSAADGRMGFEPDWREVDWTGIGADMICNFFPGCGEAVDIWLIIDPESTDRDRLLAAVSLGANILTAGESPNYGVMRRIAKKAADAEAGAAKAAKSATQVVRTTRTGEKAVRVTRADGSVVDISPQRVKEYVPNTHPNAPPGTLDRVRFPNAQPGSKGLKRDPTAEELEILRDLP